MAHKTASGRTSTAWKNLEKRVAHLLKEAGFSRAKALPSDRNVSKPDVDVPEVPELAIDTKYKNGGWNHHTIFENQVEPYRGMLRYEDKRGRRYNTCVMPTRSGGSDKIYVTLRIEDWINLLKLAFLRDAEPGWNCPSCPGKLEHIGEAPGLFVYRCKRCTFQLMTPEKHEIEEVDKSEQKSRRKKTEIIKDYSQKPKSEEEEFKPLKGQRSLKDVLKTKKEKKS